MFTIRSNAIRAVANHAARQQIRNKATTAVPKSNILPHLQQNSSFKKTWLSDPSTYPIIVIMGCGLTFMVGMGFNALFGYKDVQVNPNKRGSELQTWGQEERRGFLKRFQEDIKRQPHSTEGLGIDHEKYVQERAKYLQK